MAKPKAQTIIQRHGFKDEDLKTQKHDEIMLWLGDSVEHHIRQLLRISKNWEPDELMVQEKVRPSEYRAVLNYDHKDWLLESSGIPAKPNLSEIKGEWEHAITKGTDNKTVVGFVDMKVSFKKPSLIYNLTENRFEIWQHRTAIFIEVKSSIPSLGELIRQIRFYQVYTSGKWYVVSPDSRFSVPLMDQGINFIEYEPDRFFDEGIGPDGKKYRMRITKS